jgi:hypothetical protein
LNYEALELFKTLKNKYPDKEFNLLNSEKRNIVEKDLGFFSKEFLN